MTDAPKTMSAAAASSSPPELMNGWRLALLPLIPPLVLLVTLLENPLALEWNFANLASFLSSSSSVGAQLVAYLVVAAFGFTATTTLVPHIQQYTLRKGICGKDLGKRGTPLEDRDM
jgi:hypothetical protein